MSTRGSGIPEMAMFLSMTGLTALPCTVYAVVLQYSTLLPLLSSSCTDKQKCEEMGEIQTECSRCRNSSVNGSQMAAGVLKERSNEPHVYSSCSQRSSSSGSPTLWTDTGHSGPENKPEGVKCHPSRRPRINSQFFRKYIYSRRTQNKCCCLGRNTQRTQLRVSSGSQRRTALQCTRLCSRLCGHLSESR